MCVKFGSSISSPEQLSPGKQHMQIVIISLGGERLELEVEETTTVAATKELIQEKLGVAPSLQRLVLGEQLLEDESMLGDCRVVQGDEVQLIQQEAFEFTLKDLKFQVPKNCCSEGGNLQISAFLDDGSFEEIAARPEEDTEVVCDSNKRSKYEHPDTSTLVANLETCLKWRGLNLVASEEEMATLEKLQEFLSKAGPCKFVIEEERRYNRGGGHNILLCEALVAGHRLSIRAIEYEPFMG